MTLTNLTQASLVQKVRDILGDTPWMQGAASTADSTGVITVSDTTAWDQGAIVEFQNNGEQAWVQSVSPTTLTALRGVRGTTAATQASGIVFRDPVYGYQNIVNACNLVIQSLWPYVWQKKTLSGGITYSASTYWYTLASAGDTATYPALGLISVSQVSTGNRPLLIRMGHRGSGYPVVFQRNLPTALCADGVGVAFPRSWPNTTNVINIDYAAKMTTTQTTPGTYDDIYTNSIEPDMIAYGAAARVVKNYEVNRVSDEDTNMGDQSVQPGIRFNIGLRLEQEFIKLRDLRREELMRIIPIMGTAPGNGALSEVYSQRGPTAPYV
jgi:hypothetical protein